MSFQGYYKPQKKKRMKMHSLIIEKKMPGSTSGPINANALFNYRFIQPFQCKAYGWGQSFSSIRFWSIWIWSAISNGHQENTPLISVKAKRSQAFLKVNTCYYIIFNVLLIWLYPLSSPRWRDYNLCLQKCFNGTFSKKLYFSYSPLSICRIRFFYLITILIRLICTFSLRMDIYAAQNEV